MQHRQRAHAQQFLKSQPAHLAKGMTEGLATRRFGWLCGSYLAEILTAALPPPLPLSAVGAAELEAPSSAIGGLEPSTRKGSRLVWCSAAIALTMPAFFFLSSSCPSFSSIQCWFSTVVDQSVVGREAEEQEVIGVGGGIGRAKWWKRNVRLS